MDQAKINNALNNLAVAINSDLDEIELEVLRSGINNNPKKVTAYDRTEKT